MRGYSLYLEHYFWFIFAERSTREAQETLRRFDEKCRFAFSHVPEPKIDEVEEARLAALIKEAQADLNAEAEGSDPKKDASIRSGVTTGPLDIIYSLHAFTP